MLSFQADLVLSGSLTVVFVVYVENETGYGVKSKCIFYWSKYKSMNATRPVWTLFPLTSVDGTLDVFQIHQLWSCVSVLYYGFPILLLMVGNRKIAQMSLRLIANVDILI